MTTEYKLISPRPWTSLQEMLQDMAEGCPPRDLIFYSLGNTTKPARLSYKGLYSQAKEYSLLIRQIEGFAERKPILIYLEDHRDFVLWFWAVLLADGVPCPSTPLSNHLDHRKEQLRNLSELLDGPICVTRKKDLDLFKVDHGLRLYTVENLEIGHQLNGKVDEHGKRKRTVRDECGASGNGDQRSSQVRHWSFNGRDPTKPVQFIEHDEDGKPSGETHHGLAMLMLTSGSSGKAKAVKINHKQVLAAIHGKATMRWLTPGKPLMNWIGLDHVGSLVEIHLLAMYLEVEQIHIQAADILACPTRFLDLLSEHRVARSFAPNGFLSKLVSAVDSGLGTVGTAEKGWSLSHLTDIISGGEANDMETCVAVSKLVESLGAPCNAVTPGFGMTETCAGSIYNLYCPRHDISKNSEFASVGKCTTSIEMRISVTGGDDKITTLALPGETGSLEVRGDAVFEGYYHNEKATSEAFTSDGWFRTGDQAFIDPEGNLHLIGRTKENVNINGVKQPLAPIQTAIEKAISADVSRVVVFASRNMTWKTEQITVAYIANCHPITPEVAQEITGKVIDTCFQCTGSQPLVWALEDESKLPVSTLGKISRNKMKDLLENGAFEQEIKTHEALLEHSALQNGSSLMPATLAEIDLLKDLASVIGCETQEINTQSSLFAMGFTSMDLIRLKHQIDQRLGMSIPIIILIKYPTVRQSAAAIDDLSSSQSSNEVIRYDPVVVLKESGTRTPLWLVHPGVGEVLVFINLAKQMADEDRPIYALRARGFDPGQTCFGSINEVVETYSKEIRRRQPQGPYAIAGYSYGSMLAFEIAKRLEQTGDVKFLASFNLPPHIKFRMRQLNWNVCLVHLVYFLDFITEEISEEMEHNFAEMGRDAVLERVMDSVDQNKMAEFGLNEMALTTWADVSYSLQSIARDYEPTGLVNSMDIFHAVPLRAVAKSREDWLENHLGKWEDFSRTAPIYHEVGGEHFTMISSEHVKSFAKILVAAMKFRGL
ncbi:acyl-protein synthetase [Xylariaceae sp. FL0255]|nr:acyl-protein synthetase [Xylariaceae sp. FL0255]